MSDEKIIVKSRDDKQPVVFDYKNPEDYSLVADSDCTWAKGGKANQYLLRSRIEPWLSALFQSEHLSLLIGAGLTHAIYGQVESATKISLPTFKKLQSRIKNKAHLFDDSNNNTGNIETQIQIANELLAGLKHQLGTDDKEVTVLKKEIADFLKEFSRYILALEHGIFTAESGSKEKAFNYLVSFLISFASRSGTRDRLQIFTTNYDRVIELGAEMAGLHLLDRFVGNISPIFRSSRLDTDMHYNPPGMRGEPRYLEGVARFTKLHGSVDWIHAGRDIRRIGLPFGSHDISPYLKACGIEEDDFSKLMIYPNAAKDKETTAYPYVELFRDLAVAVCRPNNTLVTYGYGYGDDHINRVIEDMLTIPSTHLVIISYDDPSRRIMELYKKIGRPPQITLLIGKHVGGIEPLVENYLPKAAIDRVTSRMTDLLKSRLGGAHEGSETDDSGDSGVHGKKDGKDQTGSS